MNKIIWPISIIFVISFFTVFWLLPANKPIDNAVKLTHKITPDTINLATDPSNQKIKIDLYAQNPSQQEYSSQQYFYRVVINRSFPDSPGYVVKEFSKELKPFSSFVETFTWEKAYLESVLFKFRVHFNMYKRNGKEEPILVSSSTRILYLH